MQVRTQTLVKSAIIQIDAAPFKQWYQTHYGVELGNRGKDKDEVKVEVKVRSLVKAIVRWAGVQWHVMGKGRREGAAGHHGAHNSNSAQ